MKACYKPRDHEVQTEVVFVESDAQGLAAEFVVLVGRHSGVHGCQVFAAVLLHAVERAELDPNTVRAAVAQYLDDGVEALSITTGCCRCGEVPCERGS